MPRPRGKSLEQEAKAQIRPKRKPKRQPPKLTATQRVARNRLVVRDRLTNDMSWSALAVKYELSERGVRNIMAEWRRDNAGSIEMVDATGELWETLQGFEAQIERLRELRGNAEASKDWRVVLGAEKQITTVRQAKLALLQEAEMIPKNLGTLKHVIEVDEVVDRVMRVLDRVESGEIKPSQAKPELLALLPEQPAGDPTLN